MQCKQPCNNPLLLRMCACFFVAQDKVDEQALFQIEEVWCVCAWQNGVGLQQIEQHDQCMAGLSHAINNASAMQRGSWGIE